MVQQTYGFLNIYYGSTSGNSRKMAQDFKQEASAKGFLPILCSLGDFSPQRFLSHRHVVFFLSTYGQGGPTQDAEQFLKWIRSLTVETKPFLQIKFIMFGLGNSTFEFFCGMPKTTRQILLQLGAHQIIPMELTDAKDQDPFTTYEAWKDRALQLVIQNLNLQKIKIEGDQIKKIAKKFSVHLTQDQVQNWDQQNYSNVNINFEVRKYLLAQKAQVIDIKQIRNSDEGRSTLYIRIKTDSTQMTPGCNIEIYPQNIIDQSQYHGTVQFSKSHILPFPPLPLKQFMKISNISSKPSKAFVQQSLYLCQKPDIIKKYQQLLDSPYLWDNSTFTSGDIIKDLNLDLMYQASLGVNYPRVYSLAGYKKGEIELIVSLLTVNGKMGLMSRYFQSRPKQLKIKILPSVFHLTEDCSIPLVMIANGSGIAPFRSILHYYSSIAQCSNIPPLHLYYGCQKRSSDYYFKQQWQQAQTKNLIKLTIATSRQGQNKYIQKEIKDKMQQFKQLLFQKQARFFICGSVNMYRDLNNIFVAAYKQKGFKSYTALTKVKDLQKQGRLVREVFG